MTPQTSWRGLGSGKPRTRELRQGWANLAAATIGMGLGTAAYTPVSSVVFHALELQFGWSRVAATGTLIALPITALVLPIAGRLIDRFGVRLVSGISALCAVACYLWLALIGGSLGEFYAAIVAFYVLSCATGPIAYTRLIAAQFLVQRGLALAIAQFGIAFIGVLMPQFISAMIASYGWRSGYLFFAGATAAGAVAAQLLMRPVETNVASDVQRIGVAPRQAIASAGFWLLGLAILSISAASFGLISQFQSVLADRHIGLRVAATLLSLFAVSVMLSRLVVGRLLDTLYPARAAAGVIAIAAGGALLLLGHGGMVATVVAVLLVGFSIGAELDLLSFFCARLFGVRHYAAVYGLLSAFFYVGIAIGGVGYGAIRTRSGTYDPALAGSALLLGISAFLFLIIGKRRPIEEGASSVG